MNSILQAKEKSRELEQLLNDKRTGLRDSSDTNKTRSAILALFEESQDLIVKAVMEWAEKDEPPTIPLGNLDGEAARYYLFGYYQFRSDLLSFLSEGLGKEKEG